MKKRFYSGIWRAIRSRAVAAISNQRGFPIIELYIVAAIIIIIGALAVPQYISSQNRFSPLAGIENIERISDELIKPGFLPGGDSSNKWTQLELGKLLPGFETEQLNCPATGEAYELLVKGSSWKLCCPDPENHLGIAEKKSCRSSTGWMYDKAEQDSEFTANNKFSYVTVTIDENSTLSVVWKSDWIRFFSLVGTFAAIFYLGFFLSERKWLPEKIQDFSVGVSIISGFVLFGSFCALFYLLYSPQASFFNDGRIEIESKYGPISVNQTTVEPKDVIAVSSWKGLFLVIRDEEGELNKWDFRFKDDALAKKLAGMVRRRVVNKD